MSVAKYSMRKATGGFNAPMEFWGCTNSPRYHVDKFFTFSKFPNKMDPEVT